MYGLGYVDAFRNHYGSTSGFVAYDSHIYYLGAYGTAFIYTDRINLGSSNRKTQGPRGVDKHNQNVEQKKAAAVKQTRQ